SVMCCRPNSARGTEPVGPVALSTFNLLLLAVLVLCLALQSGCAPPIGVNKASPARIYSQTHENPIAHSEPSPETKFVLHRFEQETHFEASPDETLQLIHRKAVETHE